MIGERNEQVEFVVGRKAPGGGLVDGDHSEEDSAAVPHRHEQRVLGIPGVGMRLPLARRRVARAERVPVDRAVRDVVRAAPLEPLVEQDGKMRPFPRGAEQCVAGVRRSRDTTTTSKSSHAGR